MQRHVVKSAALNSLGYDPSAKILEVELRNSGGIWQYFGFPVTAYQKFINSDSLGNYFATKIKGKYPELRVR
ncbi:KTSC domain-containing protein [Mucilaginibacter sp. HC2]|uniref:KTSC domain-containing protein n=1 Tax=Mucilaginibacter inviolabilis TaxID=2714892 RepID=UPI00140B6AD6|nr:KTSC domain-containing protein [Mucilaginibacter inviolabilis]NHA04854.1 KTSC domain-containing protein [Mucilaginibacter inviolabilis]